MAQVVGSIASKPTPVPDWLTALKGQAKLQVETKGLPTGKEERWKFAQIQSVVRTPFSPAEPAEAGEIIERFSFGEEAAIELVFVNGFYAPEHSRNENLPGLTVSTLLDAANGEHAAAVQKHLTKYADNAVHPFAALNTTHLRDGVFVHLKRSATVTSPIHFLFVTVAGSTPASTQPRILIVADDNSEATFVESYAGEGKQYLTNAVTEIVCGQDCRIDHYKLQQESLDAYHVATMNVDIGKQTQFVSQAITTGGKISRNDLSVRLGGQAAYATLNGLVLIGGTQHCDNHTLLDHAFPDCPSHELYKHVLSDKASGVFKGQIYVNQIAQKTNAKQTSKTLLLSDTAQMNSQPALEIYADDVKCTHGSTTGPIDEDMIFYLRSRGVSFETARHLLTYAFAADITRRIRVESVRRRIENYMAEQHGLPLDIRINDLGAFDEKVTQ